MEIPATPHRLCQLSFPLWVFSDNLTAAALILLSGKLIGNSYPIALQHSTEERGKHPSVVLATKFPLPLFSSGPTLEDFERLCREEKNLLSYGVFRCFEGVNFLSIPKYGWKKKERKKPNSLQARLESSWDQRIRDMNRTGSWWETKGKKSQPSFIHTVRFLHMTFLDLSFPQKLALHFFDISLLFPTPPPTPWRKQQST